ncbi:MAG: tRNA (adenosine(37)-N6)-threonylcarbamoyltransferase complex ATPase subunit type 1 TsaE [Chloroflexi bacterium GWB2_49_20]|nr:MAG: tRNA (adenosine(37)-N6)-threonylcarbamoyltransferase complex ATPase subunit type 1 TsaE [Chloroflexi bacterium GWB2_49_20]OGN80308.1 MAG: tRNA (adenosine(37)-N6)-threonylcarbamoyltransferase complex ATPase subunit type 1 TsaE [Chloroflexi bacterium GWC2_49_37]OGN86052.1 MAG: tRNA (adenosine(37)-N6)-threonylcarbamoyltransferase complex ATPase subunit type 1 TsaE [Chloroflexi bacterium GWD2_49_16]HCC79354.1 tRNA (adenosine(37)-N6)-threonylcarbamoyltransferase complex ATPase subunit type 1 
MPILDANTLEIFSRSPEQTRRVGMRLGGLLQPGDLICLQGELGAGKTTLVQGLAQGWGSLEAVSSPTFVLVNIYRRPDSSNLFHLDTYRLESIPEAEELDLDDMLMQGPLVIEWPERLKPILPEEYLWVQLAYQDEEQRSMLFSPRGERYVQLLAEFRQSVFGVV